MHDVVAEIRTQKQAIDPLKQSCSVDACCCICSDLRNNLSTTLRGVSSSIRNITLTYNEALLVAALARGRFRLCESVRSVIKIATPNRYTQRDLHICPLTNCSLPWPLTFSRK